MSVRPRAAAAGPRLYAEEIVHQAGNEFRVKKPVFVPDVEGYNCNPVFRVDVADHLLQMFQRTRRTAPDEFVSKIVEGVGFTGM